MSFHPLMIYDRQRFQQSERRLVEEGPPFTFTAERRAALDDLLTKYPPDRKRSAVLAALYLLQEQQGYLTASGMRHVRRSVRRRPRPCSCTALSVPSETSMPMAECPNTLMPAARAP